MWDRKSWDRKRVGSYYHVLAPLVAQTVKNPPAMRETCVQSLDWEDPLEKGMATHSNILAWRIPQTEEPGRLYNACCRNESDTTEQLSLHTMYTGKALKIWGERKTTYKECFRKFWRWWDGLE